MGEYAAPAGPFDASDMRVAIVAGRFNVHVSEPLLAGAQATLAEHGLDPDAVPVVWVPGAFEIPLTAKRLAASGTVDAVICVGAVIKGETAHFEYVAGEAASGLQLAGLETGVPVAFGVLTVDTADQAEARVDKGADAARAALEMADLFGQVRKQARVT